MDLLCFKRYFYKVGASDSLPWVHERQAPAGLSTYENIFMFLLMLLLLLLLYISIKRLIFRNRKKYSSVTIRCVYKTGNTKFMVRFLHPLDFKSV